MAATFLRRTYLADAKVVAAVGSVLTLLRTVVAMLLMIGLMV
jgi:hypothetical protein